MKNKCFLNYCGIFSVLAFISYLIAVIFSPMAYPGYNTMKQAVSDLSAINAPSRELWLRLSAVYNVCSVLGCMMVVLGIKNEKSKLLRLGVYLFFIMEFISAIGYQMFPLSASGLLNTFSDVMHIIITAFVVLLSILSLVLIIIAGFKNKNYLSYSIAGIIALLMMLIGALGTNIVPKDYFGIVERFSVFAAVGFNAFLGIKLFFMKI